MKTIKDVLINLLLVLAGAMVGIGYQKRQPIKVNYTPDLAIVIVDPNSGRVGRFVWSEPGIFELKVLPRDSEGR